MQQVNRCADCKYFHCFDYDKCEWCTYNHRNNEDLGFKCETVWKRNNLGCCCNPMFYRGSMKNGLKQCSLVIVDNGSCELFYVNKDFGCNDFIENF